MDELPPELFAALMRLMHAPRVELMIKPMDAWMMLASLQLVLRHPGYPPNMRHDIMRITRRLIDLLSELEPDLRPYAEAGFDPSQDVPIDRRGPE